MEPDSRGIEELLEEHGPRLLAIEGVLSVTVGACEDGSPCLVIATEVPVDQIRERLPDELAEEPLKLEYQGAFGEHSSTLLGSDYQAVERIRASHETALLEIEGVVSVATGICESGKACLMIGTSVPAEQVRAQLPGEFAEIEVEVKYVGELRSY